MIEGKIVSKGGLHIEGEIRGDAEAATYLIVAPEARIDGSIHAREVYLAGVVEGDIWAIEVEIAETGMCRGTIEAIQIRREDN